MMQLTEEQRASLRRQATKFGGGASSGRAVAEFWFEDGSPLSQWHKNVFTCVLCLIIPTERTLTSHAQAWPTDSHLAV